MVAVVLPFTRDLQTVIGQNNVWDVLDISCVELLVVVRFLFREPRDHCHLHLSVICCLSGCISSSTTASRLEARLESIYLSIYLSSHVHLIVDFLFFSVGCTRAWRGVGSECSTSVLWFFLTLYMVLKVLSATTAFQATNIMVNNTAK